jgi:hypothetical protein
MKSHLSPDTATLDAMSAYLDGRLDQPETAALEDQLRTHPEWRETLKELAAIRSLLHSLPELHPPRNLILNPNDIPHAIRPNMPARLYGFGSAFAAITAILVFAFSALQAPMTGSLPSMALRAASAQDASSDLALTQAAPMALQPKTANVAGSLPTAAAPNAETTPLTKALANTPRPLSGTEGTIGPMMLVAATAAPTPNASEAAGCGECGPAVATGSELETPSAEENTPVFTLLMPIAEHQTTEQPVEPPSSPIELSIPTMISIALMIVAVALGILFYQKRKRS